MNYFQFSSAAERYATGRPDFHSNSIRHIKEHLQIVNKLDCALDIACGTGLSTKALLEIAAHIFGTDISPEMLKHAHQHENIQYAVAPAEQQPFPDQYFDLITVSSGVHWFDIDQFLNEVNRILKREAWLVLYENHFIAEMENREDFKNWFFEVYLKKFPSPPRNNTYDWTNENLRSKKMKFESEEKFSNAVTMNKRQLALYFTTQSNVIAAVKKGNGSFHEIESWLLNELNSFFSADGQDRVIYFGNWIKYIQHSDE
jgi:ubiquinone/menaquinone biosynthesis C-methylase UbiE